MYVQANSHSDLLSVLREKEHEMQHRMILLLSTTLIPRYLADTAVSNLLKYTASCLETSPVPTTGCPVSLQRYTILCSNF